MRRLQRSGRALSEIVGALMLILIVVIAATALAAFVASYQKQVQAEQNLANQRALEDFKVLSAVPQVTTGQSVDLLNLTITSLDVNTATITSIRINDQPLVTFQAYELDPATGLLTWVTVYAGGTVAVGSYEVLNVLIDGQVGSAGFSFYDPTYQLLTSSYIKVDIYTALSNDFTRTFIPPTAIGVVTSFSEFNGTGYTPDPELDGTQSFQSGNGTIIAWNWYVNPGSKWCGSSFHDGYPANFSGAIALPPMVCYNTWFNATLTVQNQDGLVGVGQTVSFYVPP